MANLGNPFRCCTSGVMAKSPVKPPHKLLFYNGFVAVFLLLAPMAARAQLKPLGQKGITRAVVIGVSDYQNERIPKLLFAHADAVAYARYLLSPAGGALPEGQVKLLTNAQATQGQMAAALTWLLEESREGDQAIIYFSGHGDMETQTMMNYGFLLTYDAPVSTYMAGGAFPVFYLQSIIQTLSTQKKVQVILITDACHAGKLAGSASGGAQATAKVLADQFANEVKLLSCQPNEFSSEGRQWGGGHGIFTYYLLDGLTGLADANGDLSVSLLELQRFLEDNVPAANPSNSQMPLVIGMKSMALAKVDPPALAALKSLRNGTQPDAWTGDIASRSVPKTGVPDSLSMALYGRFQAALHHKRLLFPEEDAAYTLYVTLKDRPDMTEYQQEMRRNLAAALQDDAQQAINDYLAANPLELRRRWSFDPRYEQFPEYLGKAAEILGEDHFMYTALRAKELYFRGLNTRLKAEQTRNPALYEHAATLQQQALQLDTAAAYAFNELGLLTRRKADFAGSIEYFQKALRLSPTWVLAETNLCGSYSDAGQPILAEQACRRAIQYDSTFALAHNNLSIALLAQSKPTDALVSIEKALKYAPDYHLSYLTQGDILYQLKDRTEAKAAWQHCIQLDPRNKVALYNLGVVSSELGEPREALEYFYTIIRIDPNYVDAWLDIAELQMDSGNYSEAGIALESCMRIAPEMPDPYYLSARMKAMQNQNEAALDALQIALEKGFRDSGRIKSDKHFHSIRRSARFKGLIKQYFPKASR